MARGSVSRLMRRATGFVAAVSVLCAGFPTAADQPLARGGGISLTAPEIRGGWCGQAATVKVVTPTVPTFGAEDVVSSGIARLLGASMPFECPAARMVRIEGSTGTGAAFTASAAAADGWQVKPPGGVAAGPIAASVNADGFMPVSWGGMLQSTTEYVTANGVDRRTQQIAGALYPQSDGRIRVRVGRCEGELVLVRRSELQSVNLRISGNERLYKLREPRQPLAEPANIGPLPTCGADLDWTNWLALSTNPDSSVTMRIAIRHTEDGPRRDRVTIERSMGVLAPIYPPRPRTVQETATEARSDDTSWAAAGLLVLGGLFLLGALVGGGGGGGHSSGSSSGGGEDFIEVPSYGSGGGYSAPASTTGFYGNCHGGAFYGC